MLEHLVHGISERIAITHTGAVLTIEVSRGATGFATPAAMAFRHETGAFHVGPAVQCDDGLLWTPVDRERSRLWIRHHYVDGDSRLRVWIVAPRTWAVRWNVPPYPEPRAVPAGESL